MNSLRSKMNESVANYLHDHTGIRKETLLRDVSKELGLGIAALGLAGATMLPATPARAADDEQYFVVLANTQGAGGSEWRSEILMNDVSGQGSTGRILLKPAGQSTPDDNAMSVPYTINKRGAITADPLATIGFTGAGTIKIIPDENQQAPGASARIWNQVSDGQQLSQSSSPLVKADFLQAGDVAYFTLPKDRDAFRFNLFALGETINSPLFVRPQTPQVDFGLFDQYGQPISGTVKDLLDNGLLQYAPATNALFGREPGNNDVLRAQMQGGLVALLGSAAQNFGSKGDAGNGTPVIDRLLKEGYVRMAPKGAEQNDTYHLEVYAKVRDGGRVKQFSFDVNGDDSLDYVIINNGDGSEYYYKESGTLGIAPGTYTPQILLTLENEQGGTFDRILKGEPYNVVPEQNYSPTDSFNKTKNSIAALAQLMGENINIVYRGDNKHYGVADMTSFLTMYTNGIAGSSDPELDHVEIFDTDNELLLNMKTGGNAVWGGFREDQIDQLKTIYDVSNNLQE